EDLGGVDLSRTVGWFTSVHPVALAAGGEPGVALKRVKEMLRAVPRRGLGFGLLKPAGVPRPQVIFNYLGQFDGSFEHGAVWQPAAEQGGSPRDGLAAREHALSIDGRVQGGELRMDVTYSAARHDRATVQAFADRFRHELEALVAHCIGAPGGLTPSDVPLAALTQADLDAWPVPAARVADVYPLSPMQEGLLFHSVFEPMGTAYVNQLRVDIGGLDVVRFKAAWQHVFDTHDVLRTGFVHAGRPLQWVARTVALPWQDLAEADLDALAQAELHRPFHLAEPPLMRFALVRLPGGRHHFIWTHHHLLLDGWSTSRLMGEVLRHTTGQAAEPAAPRFRDHIAWLGAQDRAASLRFWCDQVGALDEPSLLAPGFAAGPLAARALALDRDTTARVAAVAARERVTVNTLVQGAWALVLSQHLGRGTVCFGATVSGRPEALAGADRMLGLFINTLPVCVSLPPAVAAGDWLRALQARNLAAREHDHVPLHAIQREAGRGGQGFFDSIVVFENYPVDETLRQQAPAGLVFNGLVNREETNYPLTLVVHHGDTLAIEIRHTLDGVAAERLSDTMRSHLLALADRCGEPLGQVVADAAPHPFEQGGPREPARHAVIRDIEAQAAARPEAAAVVYGEEVVTYGALNARANRLAHRLIEAGVTPDEPVGVVLSRSVEMVVALLAVMK
ncbi:condensation domain-containing protein, partial [Rhizobacter sp. Root1221]|uniref:condensation domain-containing protein n=1 Tax=Rhizobacter sp. Root1221 TaxID=1736433 RepID=UPI000B0A3EC2